MRAPTVLSTRVFALLTIALFHSALFSQESMTVTAKRGALQAFGGFGAHPGSVIGGALNAAIVHDLNLQFIRFYVHGNTVDEIKADFNASARAQLNGYRDQNPNLFFCVGSSETVDKEEKVQPFCDKWAQFAKWVRDTEGYNVKWSSITSEPNADQWWELGYPKGSVYDRRIPMAMYADVVKRFRAAYDAQGLQDIKLYAPETGSVDETSHKYIDTLRADPAAWNCIGGFFTKTYNMGSDEYMKDLVEETGRPYFGACGANLINFYINEASNNNDHYAAEMSGRIFNDFNHMISYWAWYLPAQVWTNREAAHRLIWVSGAPGIPSTQLGPGASAPTSLKYFYLKHIAQTFDVGCRFRYCLADTALPFDDMWWTFGQKPAVAASVARNPDESWSIGVVNLTGCISDTLPYDSATHPQTLWTFYPAVTYDVTVKVEELSESSDLKFALVRSSKSKHMEFEDTVTMNAGEVTVTLAPKELVTLRGAKGAEITIESRTGRAKRLGPAGVPVVRDGRDLRVPVPGEGEYRVRLLDLAGRRAIASRRVRQDASGRASIPLDGCGAGILLLQVRGERGDGYQTKILLR
jgi:hypothetical protein